MSTGKFFETKADLRNQILKLHQKDLYVPTKIPGFYVSMYTRVSSNVGVVEVKVKAPRDTSFHTHWLSSVDQAAWLPVNLPTGYFSREPINNMVDMDGRVGTRVPGVFVANEEVDRPLQIVYTPAKGVGWVVEIRAKGDGVKGVGDAQ